MVDRDSSLASRVDYYNPDGTAAPVAWYGGKFYYAEQIIGRFPEHRVYVEPYGGAANILLRKHPSQVEVYNDLDHRIAGFFRVLRDPRQFEELIRLASLTPCSRSEFVRLIDLPEAEDPVQRVWRFFVLCRQARGGLGMSKLTPGSWAVSTRTRRMMAEPVSKYLSAIDGLPEVAERLKTVLVECMPAVKLIQACDAEDVFFYCDPPYLPQTRHGGQARMYAKEMTYDEHVDLLDLLLTCKGRVMISGYPSDLYDSRLQGWSRHEMQGRAHMANSGQSRTEVVWCNW